jgi:AmiR/NasT family two-component response regulator
LLAAQTRHQFDSALASRDVIGQAKGILMERFKVDAVRAFELLTKLSQDTNTPLRIVAQRVVASEAPSVTGRHTHPATHRCPTA